jgi:sugar O-acyltransferase (sialic acid O-acetyltransferase NeuD family)
MRQKLCKKIIILGAGGHARVIIDCLQFNQDVEITGILDSNIDLIGKNLFDIPIIGADDLLSGMRKKGVDYFVVGVGGTGNNRPRMKLFDLALSFGLKPIIVQHPSAIISTKAKIGDGCQLFPGCIVNAQSQLGINTIINSGAIIEHDCIIGNHVHVATGAKLASTVTVGNAAHIGAGATIRQGLIIGEFSIIGLGAAVVKDVAAYTTVVGVPAKNLTRVSG